MKETKPINQALSEVVAVLEILGLRLSQTIRSPFAHFLIDHEGD